MLVEWAGAGVAVELAALQAEMDALQAQVPDCLATDGDDAVFEGCNVHVRNGLDTTNTVNGSGNLIVGYNGATGDLLRGGSHNLVVGSEHSHSSYGGLVAGFAKTISGAYTRVSGGENNVASGEFATVGGGLNLTADDTHEHLP